jgi:DNA-binding transcriptional LysR family regulator
MLRAVDRPFDPVTLRVFVAVCEEGNIARAADREAMVASAVSKRIAAIEADIGSPLLTRGRRGVVATAAGETLLRQAREVLGIMSRMRAELSEFTSGVQGSVRVMASVSVLAERLPDAIARFLAQYQAVRVIVHEGTSNRIAQEVREGAADVGVVWDIADLTGVQTAPYCIDHLCVLVPGDHRFATRSRVRYADVLDEPLVRVLPPGATLDVMLRRRAAALGKSPAPRIEVSGPHAACRIVKAGLGVAVLPEEGIAAYATALGLALVPLADAWATRRFVVCARPEAALSATARLLFRHLATAPATLRGAQAAHAR